MKQLAWVFVALVCVSIPGRAQGPGPFMACAETFPHAVSLNVRQEPSVGGVLLKISRKNLTKEVVDVWVERPRILYSARVLDAAGAPVELTASGHRFYERHGPLGAVIVSSNVYYYDLKPNEELTDEWMISDLFDFSKPGRYSVSLKQYIDDAILHKTTLCSNSIEVVVRP